MKNELQATETAKENTLPTLPEQFSEETLKKLYDKVEAEVKPEVFDVTTQDGRARIKAVALNINKSKAAIDDPIRAHLRAIKAIPKLLEKSARDSKLRFESLRTGVLEPLQAAQRKQDVLLDNLNEIPMLCNNPSVTSEQLSGYIETANVDMGEIWPELAKKFKVAIEAANTVAKATLTRVQEQERQTAELAELKAKQEKAEQEERERKLKEEAAEAARKKAEKAAEQAKLDTERRAVEAKQREEKAVQDAEQAKREAEQAKQLQEERAKQAEAKAKQAAIDAKLAAEKQAEQAAINERKRIEEEEAEAQRQAKAREDDKNHRIKINRAILVKLVAAGISEEDAKTMITMLARKELPNAFITY